MERDVVSKRNASGCLDLTAHDAINNISKQEDERFHKLLHMIFDMCELSGFHLEGRVTLIDNESGRIFR